MISIITIIIIIIKIIILLLRTQNRLGHAYELRNIGLKFIVFVSLVTAVLSDPGLPNPSSYARIGVYKDITICQLRLPDQRNRP